MNSLMPINQNGDPVKKTKLKYPYSYDPFIVQGSPGEYECTDYSDRLMQWNWDKFYELSEKHFGNRDQIFYDRPIDKIESFLQDYHNNPKLKLVMVSEGANVSNGYPYWIFFYKKN